MTSSRPRRRARRRAALTTLVTAAVAAVSLAAPAAQASGPASWAAEKLAGGVAGGAGSAAFGAALSAIGLDAQTNQFAAIRRDLAEIKQRLDVVSRQLSDLSAQLSQQGCNVASQQLGPSRALSTDAWERYEGLIARATEAARREGLPEMRRYLDSKDFRGARKQIHTQLTAPGSGAQSLLQTCGPVVERSTYPFFSTLTQQKVRAFLDDWQFVQVRLSAIEVERLMLAGQTAGAAEEVASLRRDLAAQDKLLPKPMPGDIFLDLRTNLIWSRKAEATTFDAIRASKATLAETPSIMQVGELLLTECCTVGGKQVSRQQWLEQRAGVDFRGYLNRNPPMAGLWVQFHPLSFPEQWVVRLIHDVPWNGTTSTPSGMVLRTKETHVLLRVRPRRAGEDWSIGRAICLATDQAAERTAGEPPAPRGRKTVRRVGRAWYGTPSGDVITTGARATVHGGKGPDVITVGSRSVVYGGGCNDVIHVKGSGSTVHGGKDHDTVRVLGGRATVYGGHGNDDLRGGRGDDRISGGAGRDTIDGGAGDDRLTGGTGRDTIRGGSGDDVIHARDGERDVIDCGPGRDVAYVDRHDVVEGCERVVRR